MTESLVWLYVDGHGTFDDVRRPTMIESHAATVVPLPLALDEQHLPRDTLLEHTQPNTPPTTMAFCLGVTSERGPSRHIAGLAFYKTLGIVNVDTYEAWPKGAQSRQRAIIVRTRSGAYLWSDSLPPHLVPGNNIDGKQIHLRQANVLRQRFLHARMLLHWPITVRFEIIGGYRYQQLNLSQKHLAAENDYCSFDVVRSSSTSSNPEYLLSASHRGRSYGTTASMVVQRLLRLHSGNGFISCSACGHSLQQESLRNRSICPGPTLWKFSIVTSPAVPPQSDT